MRNNTVWDAMSKAFENSKGDLAEWMMAALKRLKARETFVANNQRHDCCQRQTDRHVLAG